jgi:hypothetical protein
MVPVICKLALWRLPSFSFFAAIFLLCHAPLAGAQAERRSGGAMGEDPIVQENAAAYYARKYHVDPKEAERRIAIQDRAAGIEDEIARALGDQYAGIWYDHADGGRLKIGMTAAAMRRADELRGIGKDYGVFADMDLVTVRFTLAELEQKQDMIRKRISDMVEAGHARISYDTKTNNVIVTALAKLSSSEESRVKDLANMAGVTVHRLDQPDLRSKLLACNVTFCDPPFRGGREIAASNSTKCTVAFIARDQANPNELWALTAGHCIFFEGTNWEAKDESNIWGVVGASAFYDFAGGPGRDAGKIKIKSTSNGGAWGTPTPLAAVIVKSSAGGSTTTTYDPQYEIKATSWSSIGQVLCRTGGTTGTECGEVSELGVDESSVGPDGKTYAFHEMGKIDVCGAQGGDSGGPLYKAHRAFGILSGANSGCYETYQGVRAAEGALNITVILAP